MIWLFEERFPPSTQKQFDLEIETLLPGFYILRKQNKNVDNPSF